jgi:hypothetical protein
VRVGKAFDNTNKINDAKLKDELLGFNPIGSEDLF